MEEPAATLNIEDFRVDQLREIIAKWRPGLDVDLDGVMIDYLSRTRESFVELLDLNPRVRDYVVAIEDPDVRRDLLQAASALDRDTGGLRAAYDELRELLPEAEPTLGTDEPLSPTLPDSGAGTVFWQLSDIHFGRFDVWVPDPEDMAAALLSAVDATPEARPDFIVISGDLTSMAADDEFTSFVTFCKYLSRGLWGRVVPQRILVVPGNHDTVWMADGTTDKLARFRKRLASVGCCITPFGPATKRYEDPVVHVTRHGLGSKSMPPFALVRMSEFDVEFVLMVSSFYSGAADERMRKCVGALTDSSSSKDAILELARADTGALSLKYLHLIQSTLEPTDLPRIALTHHNLVAFGREPSMNPSGLACLRTLPRVGVRVVLHGHVHLFEAKGDVAIRPDIPALARSIPCSTLASYPAVGSSCGFMVHQVNRASEPCLETWAWETPNDDVFRDDLLRRAYKTDL
jgi:hypothetical protein